jgi:phi13 family phage major tail protein
MTSRPGISAWHSISNIKKTFKKGEINMTIAAGEYKSTIGLDDLYYALVTVDSATAYTAGTPKTLAPAAEASQEPATSMTTQNADDQPFDNSYGEGPTKITLTVTALPLITLAEITGNVYDAVNGLMYDGGGIPPDCALLFRSKKSNGNYKYYEYLKGNFEKPKEAHKTKGDTTEFQPVTLVFTALRTMHKFVQSGSKTESLLRLVGDEDIANFDGSDWFTQVTVPPAVPGTSV